MILTRFITGWLNVALAFALGGMAGDIGGVLVAQAAEAAKTGPETVESSIEKSALDLIEIRCLECHNRQKKKADLDLSRRETLLQGGENGKVVIAGDSKNSLLYQLAAHAKDPAMPYKRDRLSAEEIATLGRWIDAGLPFSRTLQGTPGEGESSSFAISEADRQHWAFQKPQRPSLPALRNSAWPRNPVDHFVLAALESKGIEPAVPAKREKLIRRMTLDLIGLPPTPEEVDAFLADASPAAAERLVERLLASPAYGERWGRHWLDLARFGESDGFEHDAVRPHAWRYRDYVIDAFNADKPYDRFIREQAAGDELFPQESDAIIASGFNLLGPDMVDSADQLQRRHNTLNDMTDTTAFAFLGLTMACARCHDHKFEPLSQRDYYRFQAFFTPAIFERERAIGTPDERAAHDRAMRQYGEAAKAQQKEIALIEEPMRKKLYEEKLAKLSEEAQLAVRTPKNKRTTEQENQVQETADSIKVAESEVLEGLDETSRSRLKRLKAALKKIIKPEPPAAAIAMRNSNGVPAKAFLLARGEPSQPGEAVSGGFPAVLSDLINHGRAGERAGPRAELAAWLASEENPLTARVMVNRIWQHHFGRGIVATPSDFGVRGARPSHPELLVWLAAEFVSSGWSVKHIHKLILLSAAYQQSERPSPTAMSLDPENLLFSRWKPLRLEGEVIRDSLLAVSSRLNTSCGGPGVFPAIPVDVIKGYQGWPATKNVVEQHRRSVYIFARRNFRYPFLEVFDAPDSNLSCPSRERSTTAPQALALLNAADVIDAAGAVAARILSHREPGPEAVEEAYRLILGRQPASHEVKVATQFLDRSPFSEFCRALFNLNEFVYVN